MARYFAAKSITYRPFVYRALHYTDHMNPLTEADKRDARTAVGSALLSVKHGGLLHEPWSLLLHPINSWRWYVYGVSWHAFNYIMRY